jgi:stearoyl-CoA desaturase (Delta-9 desaturase)
MTDWWLSVLVYGVLKLTLWEKLAVTLLLTHITIASVTIFLHRHQSHRALDLHPLIAHGFRFWLWLTTGMVTKEWVAIHRKHHSFVDASADPHSPQVHGISKVLWQGAELYRAESANRETLARFGTGTPDDWLEHRLYSRYPALGICLMFALDVLLFGVHGISVWGLQMLWIPFFAAGVVNGIGHYFGYRNFESADASTNIVPWGVLIGGEELHNNHHAFPSSAKLSVKPWEFDIGWFYIRTLELCRLARVRHLAPVPKHQPGKLGADLDTVQAVVRYRMHVMAHYGDTVVATVHRQEMQRTSNPDSRGLLKVTRPLLLREGSRLDDDARHRLQRGLACSDTLQIVYQFKLQLQALWKEHPVSQESALQALTEWCHQAEDTGILALQQFARSLCSYTLRKV